VNGYRFGFVGTNSRRVDFVGSGRVFDIGNGFVLQFCVLPGCSFGLPDARSCSLRLQNSGTGAGVNSYRFGFVGTNPGRVDFVGSGRVFDIGNGFVLQFCILGSLV